MLLLMLTVGSGQVLAAKPPSTKASLKALVRQTNTLPPAAASAKKRRALERTAAHARRVAKKRPCTSVKDLTRYRRVLRGIKVNTRAKSKRRRKTAARLAALGPASLKASRVLLASKKTKRCGGGTKPSTLDNTKVKLLKSDANGLKVRVQLPALRFAPRTGGGKSWTALALPNTDAPGKPGTPGIPVASSILGVPDGASPEVKSSNAKKVAIDGVDVFPVQPEPVDQASKRPDFDKPPFATKPFAIDGKAYSSAGLVPAKPADADLLGTARDLKIGALQIPAAQYDPKSKKLVVLNSVDVTITFKGGSHTFSDELASPWEQSQRRLAASLLNAGAIKTKRPWVIRRCGEQMLVITSAATRAAADQFAAAKRAQGWRTNVFETGAGAGQIGTTATQIQAFIRGRLSNFLCVRPSYVTIMGDDDLVPTFTTGPGGIPSDNPYSTKNDSDELPDLAVGRIIGNDQAAVATAVTKIIAYETTAPTGNGMLGKALIAAQFQDDDNDGQENRTFIQFAETVRNGLVNRGVAVDRVYGEHPGNNPQRFNDGTDLPAALRKPGFGWNGTGAQVSAGWNEGRFMVIHRDHGWSDGWGTPGYGTADVQALTNASRLPVVLSVNCSSGAYDYDETSFAGESLVKPDGGSVGVFGDTRDSPSWHNSQIALGFVDALLPSVLPSEGPATKQRTGDALIHGKLRLAGLAPPSGPGIAGGDGNTRNELYLWHYFGDPTMQMWGGGSPPIIFDLAQFAAVYKQLAPSPTPGPPPYLVEVALPKGLAGQAISLLRNGEVIGKAIAGDGVASIPASFGEGTPKPGELRVAVDAEGAQPVSVPVQGIPEPPTPPTSTTLTQSCPTSVNYGSEADITVSGMLTAAPPGSTVNVTYQAPPDANQQPGRTVVVPVTTDAQGAWTATFTTDQREFGDWTVSSSYAGDAQHMASQGGPCTIEVIDNS